MIKQSIKFRLPIVYIITTTLLLIIAEEKCYGSKTRECTFVSEGPKMCDGNPYFEQIVSTPGFCEMYRCQVDDKCDGFTFFASENKCSLFSRCNENTVIECPENETCLTGLCQDIQHGTS